MSTQWARCRSAPIVFLFPYQTTSLLGHGIRTPLSNNLNNVEQHKQLLFYGLPHSLFLSADYADYTNLSVRTPSSNNLNNVEQHKQLLFGLTQSWDHAKSLRR